MNVSECVWDLVDDNYNTTEKEKDRPVWEIVPVIMIVVWVKDKWDFPRYVTRKW